MRGQDGTPLNQGVRSDAMVVDFTEKQWIYHAYGDRFAKNFEADYPSGALFFAFEEDVKGKNKEDYLNMMAIYLLGNGAGLVSQAAGHNLSL